MCIVEDEQVDPGKWEPGREHIDRVDKFIRTVKWVAAIVAIPILAWMGRVEGFVQKGDRQTALMASQQHQEIAKEFDAKIHQLPPELYRNYVDGKFDEVHDRLDFIQGLILNGGKRPNANTQTRGEAPRFLTTDSTGDPGSTRTIPESRSQGDGDHVGE